ncbi:hypothetical protein ElyMa_001249300 [Elysia marginata]|uniref:Sulfotransferase domain-containing protein n=1 Tax=Elysia marginata TaxID=1093978 RepID=A0AAV4IAV1_9GAST|nr:hypothetical protein ElyMa_001249300 [Elysia marginata]
MKKHLANGLLAAGFLGMTTLCLLQTGSRICGTPVLRAVTRTETVVDLRRNKTSGTEMEESSHGQTSPAPGEHATPQKVIILTYMRSGSSLTGNILQQSPQVRG